MSASAEVDMFHPRYYPDDHLRFRERRDLRRKENSRKSLTGSFLGDLPARVDSVIGWEGSALESTDYVIQLDEVYLQEIKHACAEFMGLSLFLMLSTCPRANN